MIIHRRTSVYDFNFHLVWVTKYRKHIFVTPTKRNEMKNMLLNIAKRRKVTVNKLEVLPDHVHMLISFVPNVKPSSVAKSFKGGSAKEWFERHPEDRKKLYRGHLWSPSYFMSTLGNMSKKTVENYISNQLSNYRGSLSK